MNNKKQKSVTKMLVAIFIGIGIIVCAMCALNVAAYVVLEGHNANLVKEIYALKDKIDSPATHELVQQVDYYMERIDIKITGTLVFNYILCILSWIIVIIAGLIAYFNIGKPVQHISLAVRDVVGSIERNEGDLTVRVEYKDKKDDITQLAKDVNTFIEVLQGTMSIIKTGAFDTMSSAVTVVEQIENSNERATAISSSAEELAASTEEISATLTQLMASSNTISTAAKDMSDNAVSNVDEINDIKARVSTVQEQAVHNKQVAIETIHNIEEELSSSIQDSESVQRIQKLTDDILAIANKTNLLALNASIEAARAGEAGRGFAVVAEQISQLADSSKTSASNIQQINEVVIAAVQRLAEGAKTMIAFVDKDVVSDYDAFVEMANQYFKDAENISCMFTKFVSNAAEVADTMQTMNTNISEISLTMDESAKAVTSVAEDVGDLVQAMHLIQQETEVNKITAGKLSGEVERFAKL